MAAHQDMKNDAPWKVGTGIVIIYLTDTFPASNFARHDDNY